MSFIPLMPFLNSPTPGKFVFGPQVVSYSRASQAPMQLLESITPLEMASCVPFVRITQIDPLTGKALAGKRPIMVDLMLGQQFGESTERFLERSLVSLKTIEVKTTLSYGTISFKEVDISFRVHKPELVFRRDSGTSWRSLLDEGTSHVLEYGWSADPRVVKNELFNGVGFKDDTGLTVSSIESLLLVIYRYEITLTPSGEIDVVVKAMENGDLALRESKLGDTVGTHIPPNADKKTLARSKDKIKSTIKSMIDSIPKKTTKGHGDRFRMLDVLNTLVAQQVDFACKTFGYSSVRYFAGNFNKRAESTTPAYGSIQLSGRSIVDFEIPTKVLTKIISDSISVGKDLTLMAFIQSIANTLNAPEAWADPKSDTRLKPNIEVNFRTLRDPTKGTTDLVLHISDRLESLDPFTGSDVIDLDQQTRSNVFKKLADLKIPILEFGRGKSLIIDASFQIQMDPLLQSIQVEQAFKGRKDQVQQNQNPDMTTRVGNSSPRELIPISTLEGDITMVGNFVLDALAGIWIEFYGASQISGIFRVLEKSDTIEPGRFRSRYKLISDGLDPLNTRLRKSKEELAKIAANAQALKAKQTKKRPRK